MSETILVTGASAGFGQAICRRLVADGHRVIGAARRIEKLQKLQEELGESFYPLQMDVTDLSQVDHALASLPADWSQIDVLINNAGLALGLAPAQEAEMADWLTMIQTNIVGLAYLTRQILPQMVERNDGYIINMGSTAGTVLIQVPISTELPRLLSNNSPSIFGQIWRGRRFVSAILNLVFVKGQNSLSSVLKEMKNGWNPSIRMHMPFSLKTLQIQFLGCSNNPSTST